MDLTELSCRLFLLIASTMLLYYFSNRNRSETMNPLLMLVAMCTFTLCYLFTKVEVGIGIGFGLFAIFSILRFRTRPFNVNVVIFLFTTITLSIVDIMYPTEDLVPLCIFQTIIIVAYFISTLRVIRYNNSMDLKLEYKGSESVTQKGIHDAICDKLNLEHFAFKIEGVDATSKHIKVKVFF